MKGLFVVYPDFPCTLPHAQSVLYSLRDHEGLSIGALGINSQHFFICLFSPNCSRQSEGSLHTGKWSLLIAECSKMYQQLILATAHYCQGAKTPLTEGSWCRLALQREQWLCTPRGSDGFLLLTSFRIPCISPPGRWLSACLRVVALSSSLSLYVSCFPCFFPVLNLLLRLPRALFLSLSWPRCEIGVNASSCLFVPPQLPLHRDVAFYASLVVALNLSISLSTVGGSSSRRLHASCLLSVPESSKCPARGQGYCLRYC